MVHGAEGLAHGAKHKERRAEDREHGAMRMAHGADPIHFRQDYLDFVVRRNSDSRFLRASIYK